MDNYIIDYHIHSSFSVDSKTPMESIIKSSIKKRIKEICFTEHKDLFPDSEVNFVDYYGPDYIKYYNDIEYSKKINFFKKKYNNQLDIKKGVEIDFKEETINSMNNFISNHKFDFIIASVHSLDFKYITPSFFKNRRPHNVFKRYFEKVLLLSHLSNYNVIGHIDYVKRHCNTERLNPRNFKETIRDILINIINKNKGIELNTSGWRQGIGEPYPSPYILKMYKNLGGEIITIGSDSHNKKDVGADICKGLKMLKEIGFDGIYSFKKRIGQKILF